MQTWCTQWGVEHPFLHAVNPFLHSISQRTMLPYLPYSQMMTVVKTIFQCTNINDHFHPKGNIFTLPLLLKFCFILYLNCTMIEFLLESFLMSAVFVAPHPQHTHTHQHQIPMLESDLQHSVTVLDVGPLGGAGSCG